MVGEELDLHVVDVVAGKFLLEFVVVHDDIDLHYVPGNLFKNFFDVISTGIIGGQTSPMHNELDDDSSLDSKVVEVEITTGRYLCCFFLNNNVPYMNLIPKTVCIHKL